MFIVKRELKLFPK